MSNLVLCLRSCVAPFCTIVSLNAEVLVATHPTQPEGSQRIYHNENHTYSCLFHTVMYGQSALVHDCLYYPLHSFYFCFLGFGFVLFGVYLDGFSPLFMLSIWSFNFWPFFFQTFYFKGLVREEQKLHLPEDRSNRPSGSVINGIMTRFVIATLEKVHSSPSCANPVAHLSVQTDGHLWHTLSETYCTGTDCCLLAWFLQSSNNSAGPSRRFYHFTYQNGCKLSSCFCERKKILDNAYFPAI